MANSIDKYAYIRRKTSGNTTQTSSAGGGKTVSDKRDDAKNTRVKGAYTGPYYSYANKAQEAAQQQKPGSIAAALASQEAGRAARQAERIEGEPGSIRRAVYEATNNTRQAERNATKAAAELVATRQAAVMNPQRTSTRASSASMLNYNNARQQYTAAKERENDLRQNEWVRRWQAEYGNLSRNADFAGKSVIVNSRETDADYRYINQIGGYDRLVQSAAQNALANPMRKYDYMTRSQKAEYNYVYNTRGLEAARRYLEGITYGLNEQRAQDVTDFYTAQTMQSPAARITMSAVTPVINQLGGAGLMDAAGQAALKRSRDYKPVDYNRPAGDIDRTVTAIRGAVAGDLEEKHGKAAAFFYNQGMNQADVLVGMLTGLGTAAELREAGTTAGRAAAKALGNLPTTLIGMEAGTRAMMEAAETGATDRQIVGRGLAAAAAEMLFEKASLGLLLKTPRIDTLRKYIWSALKQAPVEASEEVFTTVANTLADAILMGDKNDWTRRVLYYQGQGMDSQAAQRQAFIDWTVQLGGDALGGALGGLFFGMMFGGGSVLQTRDMDRQLGVQAKAAMKDIGMTPEDAGRMLVDEGLRAPEGSEARKLAEEMERQFQKGVGVTDREIGRLARHIREEQERAAEVARNDNPSGPSGATSPYTGEAEGTDSHVGAEAPPRSDREATAPLAQGSLDVVALADLFDEGKISEGTYTRLYEEMRNRQGNTLTAAELADLREEIGQADYDAVMGAMTTPQSPAQTAPLAQGSRESTAVDDDPEDHTAAEQRVIEEYKAAVDKDLVAFYNEAKGATEARKNAPAYELHPVSDRAAGDIQSITGVDPTGFRTLFEQRQANHIHVEHGENGRADQTMADDNDVGRIQYVLDNYDSVEPFGRTDAYWEPNGKDGNRTAKVVRFSKKVNGTYFIVEAVPDTKARAVYVVSAYMLGEGKTQGVGESAKTGATRQPTDTQRSQRHGRTATDGIAPAPTVAQTGEAVKEPTELVRTKQRPNELPDVRLQMAQSDTERSGITAGAKREDIDAAVRISEAIGKKILFYRRATQDGTFENGREIDGVLYVNTAGEKPLRWVVAHELTHTLEKSGLYPKLQAIIRQRVSNTGGSWEKMKDERRRFYKPEELDSEITADYVADHLLTDEAAIRDLVKEDRATASRILTWLRKLLKKLGSGKAAEKLFVENAVDLYARALADTSESRNAWLEDLNARYERGEIDEETYDALFERAYQGEEGGNAVRLPGEERRSITETDDGKRYVQADRQVLTGDDPEQWGKQIEQYINEKIRQGEDVLFPTEDGHMLALTERSAYKLSDRHEAKIGREARDLLSDERYGLKGRIATHIDELIQVGRFDGYEPDLMGEHENDVGEDGFNYFTAFFQDFDGTYYRVPFSAGVNDDLETAYSVGQPRQRRKRPAGSRGSSAPRGGAQSAGRSSGDIIYTAKDESQEEKSAMQIAFEKAQQKKQERESEVRRSVTGGDTIKREDVWGLREIGRKSVNDFTTSDIKKAKKWAALYYHQMGVKSPFFRAWFGDWRDKDITPVVVADIPVYVDSNEERKAKRGDYLNHDTGWTIRVSREGETNTISHSGKGRLSEKGLSGIDALIQNAVLLDSEVHEHHPNNAKEDMIAFDHKFYALGTSEDGGLALYKITIEETYQDKKHTNDNRFHNLKYIEKVAEHIGSLTAGIKGRRAESTNDGSTTEYTVADLFALVKRYDSKFNPKPPSKVVNEDGTPKVVYHGTSERFTVFDRTKGRSNMDIQGMFFSPWEIDAGGYGENVGAFYLSIKNPAPEGIAYRALNRFKGQNDAGIKAREYLISLGYDGVNNSDEEYIAFYPEQIKSATDNVGTFDPEDPDIRYSITGGDTPEETGGRIATAPAGPRNDAGAEAQGSRRPDPFAPIVLPRVPESTTPTRDATRGKARDRIEKAERDLRTNIMRSMGVPFQVGKDYLRPITEEITEEYLRDGTVSPDTIERLFETAWRNGVEIDREFYDTYKDAKEYLRTVPVTVTEKVKADITDYGAWMRGARGLVRIVNEGGVPVDVLYDDLSSRWPGLFLADITHPSEQLRRMVDAARNIRISEKTLEDVDRANGGTYRQGVRADFGADIEDAMRELHDIRRYIRGREQKEETKAAFEEALPKTPEEAAAVWKDIKIARREYEKANAKALLTDEDRVLIGKLLRREIDPDAIDETEYPKEDILKVAEKLAEYERLMKIIRAYNAKIKDGKRAALDGFLSNLALFEDKKKGLAYSTETMERNIRDIVKDRELAERIIDTIFRPVHEGTAAANRTKNRYRDRIRALNLSRKAPAKDKASEAYAVQFVGEALDNIQMLRNSKGRLKVRDGHTLDEWEDMLTQFWRDNDHLDRGKIMNAIEEFRSIYDELFEEMNRARVLNGYEPVNYRRGYFPHFQEDKQDGILKAFGKAMGIQTEITALPTTINGLTQNFKPGIRWMRNALERKGYKTVYDAVEGFDRYIEAAADVIHQTENIQRLRIFANQIRYQAGDEGIRKRIREIEADPTLSEEEQNERVRFLRCPTSWRSWTSTPTGWQTSGAASTGPWRPWWGATSTTS